MTQAAAEETPLVTLVPLPQSAGLADTHSLLTPLVLLALPVLAEHVLHMVVGVTDTYLANHLPENPTAAAAAIGTVTYFLWFFGLIAGAIATGSTAIIARAVGARHKSLANSVSGQSVSAAVALGAALGIITFVFAEPIGAITGLDGEARRLAVSYMRILSPSLPFSTLMFVAGGCLRGAGDTLSPALAMIAVDIVNVLTTFAFTRGWVGLPAMGFRGIALGTLIAYVLGGLILLAVLLRGSGVLRLHLHRLPPHWHTLRRVLRIGLPAGTEGFLAWLANFGVLRVINEIDRSSVMAAAHINAIRVESVSFMSGLAFATAAATLVGQSLGARNPRRAARAAGLAYAIGGGAMTVFGMLFILFGRYPAAFLSDDPQIVAFTTRCLFITGFVQCGFASAMIFGGALRGAGDSMSVMVLNLVSVILVRFGGALIVAYWFGGGLVAIWIVLAAELMVRGLLVAGRFLHGGWKRVEV